jgi:hypothetical protein
MKTVDGELVANLLEEKQQFLNSAYFRCFRHTIKPIEDRCKYDFQKCVECQQDRSNSGNFYASEPRKCSFSEKTQLIVSFFGRVKTMLSLYSQGLVDVQFFIS